MDRGPAVRFGNDEQFTSARKILNIGRQRRQIAQSAKDWVSFVTQDPEGPAGRCGHFVKDVFAVTEKREIVVVEPPQKVPDLGKRVISICIQDSCSPAALVPQSSPSRPFGSRATVIIGWITRWTTRPLALIAKLIESTRNGMSSLTISTIVCGDDQPSAAGSGL
jgi:hypothetical protein